MSSMTYSEFLDVFIEGLRKCVAWVTTIFTGDNAQGGLGSVIFSNHFIFTIMMISILCFITEEIVGVLTMFRLGGFVFRRFSSRYNSGYKVNYETEYPKAYDVDYSQEHFGTKMNPRYRQKYFIQYNGKYYPFRHSRYNPFYARQFNSAYKSGRIVSYSEMYGKRVSSNVAGSSHGAFGSSYSNAYSTDGLKGAFDLGKDIALNAHDMFKKKKNPDDMRTLYTDAELAEYENSHTASTESNDSNVGHTDFGDYYVTNSSGYDYNFPDEDLSARSFTESSFTYTRSPNRRYKGQEVYSISDYDMNISDDYIVGDDD